ncbi:MAG TPA: hypothetical protein VFM46_00985, partial [Pseudomonadales bacterium]|nr:hypothetical protein [Pseudomonadales bacterium]
VRGAGAIELVIPNDPDYQNHPEYLAPLRALAAEPEFADLPLRISVGRGGLERALASDSKLPLLSVFVWSSSYHALKVQRSGDPGAISAVFADPDPVIQLELAKAFSGDKEKVATLVSSDTTPAVQRAEKSPLKVEVQVTDRKNLFKSLRQVSADAPLFLAIPDPELFNGETSGSVIETLFDQRKAVIGYSPAFVKAGALATVHSEPEELTRQIREVLTQFKRDHRLPAERYPKYFKLAINERVARWLNYSVPDQTTLLNKLQQAAEVSP